MKRAFCFLFLFQGISTGIAKNDGVPVFCSRGSFFTINSIIKIQFIHLLLVTKNLLKDKCERKEQPSTVHENVFDSMNGKFLSLRRFFT